MRRYVLAFSLLAIIGAATAGLYGAYAIDSEYARLIALGDRAATADQPFEALEAYSGAITLRPESMLAHLKRGRMYRDRGELEAAARDLRRAVDLDPTATLPLELLADTYLSMERHDRAAERYQAYLAIDDRSPQVWYKLGLAHFRAGQAGDAIRSLERAVALDRNAAEAHLLLGLCLSERNQWERARSELETATRLAPALAAPREALAALYAEAGDLARSIDQLAALAALDANSADRQVALGLAYARARRHEAAVLTLSRAVERFPNEPRVYGALGRVWLDAADARNDRVSIRKAVEALSTAAAHSDVTSETLTDFGRALMLTGDLVAAERVLRLATGKRPVAERAFELLADVAARNGHVADAREALVHYAALMGDGQPRAAVAAQIAALSIRLGETGVAREWIDRAVDEDGETPALIALRRRAGAGGRRTKN